MKATQAFDRKPDPFTMETCPWSLHAFIPEFRIPQVAAKINNGLLLGGGEVGSRLTNTFARDSDMNPVILLKFKN